MYKIVIIGAGQLGSRHLQGLAQSKFNISIEAVEPFESSRVTAEERYYQIEGREYIQDIQFYDAIHHLSNQIDLCIIATGADVRSKVTKELLSTKKVSNLILEKVLFQKISEYTEIEQILKDTDTKCWVNHPRRMYPTYKALKKEFQDANQISYSFHGGDWGLGCNALHFIDHLAYLSGEKSLEVSNIFLDNYIYDSKRNNFIEFNGLLVGKLGNHTFSLYSNKEMMPSTFTISSDNVIVRIREPEGVMEIARKKNNWEWETTKEKIIYFQSELSQVLIEDILIKDICFLPTYQEAMELHIPFIKCLLNHMEKVSGKEHTLCPIT